jgi:hypothetical protein
MGVQVLNVNRIGQISGTTAGSWPLLVDPAGNPLLTDTGKWWNVIGVDEGANAEHSDGRLYIFFGDVATDQSGNPPENADLVAWVDEPTPLRHGGHLAMGWNFQLPVTGPGIEGQPNWQFCLKCSALFWNGDTAFKGRCSLEGTHNTFGLGLDFSLPFEPTGIAGQDKWRFCAKCGSLFWEGNPASTGACPAGGTHVAAGWRFIIPVTPGSQGGQQDWRFCARCNGLFFDGYPSKGICAGSPGGGVHLNAVTQDGTPAGRFDAFRGPEPIGYTGSNETPNGAFSYDGRMYVFAGFTYEKYSHRHRLGDPQPGQYLFSKADPSKAGTYDVEFMVSPKLGWCAHDASRTLFESHFPLGFHLLLAHDLAPSPSRRSRWRCCRKCEAVFFDGSTDFKGVCQRGGGHEADPSVPDDFSLEAGASEDAQNQSNWKQCHNCLALYWAADDTDAGLCPASGQHVSTGELFRVPHTSLEPYSIGQPDWRFCDKCYSLFWNGDGSAGICSRDFAPHEAAGFNFQVPFTPGSVAQPDQFWRFCTKCASLYFQGDGGICPRDHGAHNGAGWYFSPPHDLPETLEWQGNWRKCVNCAALYFDGYPDNGHCPATGGGHSSLPFGLGPVYVLAHNPGADAHTRDNFRFCVRCHGLVRADQFDIYPWVAPNVVNNAEHPVLRRRSTTGEGLVMIGYDWNANFRLSWLPLTRGARPRFDSIYYYHAANATWTDVPDNSQGYELFQHPMHPPDNPAQYTHVSASWLPGPRCWIVLFSAAWDITNQFDQPIIARFSPDLMSWSEMVPLFSPNREGAYGVWMHDPQHQPPDRINPDLPPSQPPGQNTKAWAYGAFIIDRYTTWDESSRTLKVVYLMSPASPYQIQLMETTLRLPDPVA